MTILGLDVGDRRIGVAVSDELGYTAQGIGTIQRRGLDDDISELKRLSADYAFQEIVVGLPKNLDGTIGTQAQKVLDFVAKLQGKFYNLPIVTWDERFSSQAADRALEEAGLHWRKRKLHIDKLAAVCILQNYLDYKDIKAKREEGDGSEPAK